MFLVASAIACAPEDDLRAYGPHTRNFLFKEAGTFYWLQNFWLKAAVTGPQVSSRYFVLQGGGGEGG